jgi:SRSO17 transposase
LLHFVGNAPWSDAAMLDKVRELVLPVVERSGPIEAWIIDDTGFPKRRHGFSQERAALGRGDPAILRSARQAGQLSEPAPAKAGVAVSLSLANRDASLPVAYRLYLPEDWAKDQGLRRKAKIPQEIAFQTKPQIALEQIKAARAAGLPEGVVLMDAGYGNDTELRTAITALGISYVAGIVATTTVWPPGGAPLLPQTRAGRGRPQTRLQRDSEHQPISVKAPGSELTERGLANSRLARGQCRAAILTLCPPAGAARRSRRQASPAARRGVAADRVAGT